jgi:AraC-like DNA-binding protein
LNVDVERVLQRAAIPRSRFQGARARLSVQELFAFWHALEAVGGRRDLGLRIGAIAEPHQLDVAALAAIHSDDLGDAFAKFARYKRVVCGEEVSIETSQGEASVRFHWVHIEDVLPLMLVDATFASLLALAAHGVGAPVTPIRVELARRRADEPMLREAFSCPIYFDAPLDRLVLDAKLLARPFITRNADVVAMLVPGLESALAEATARRTLIEDVSAVLNRRMSGERPSVDKIARELGISQRTLQRRLSELGTSYQVLLDDVRHDASRRLLANTDLDAGEIAFLLGFEELNSFSRAFHAWEGETPTRWRDEHAARSDQAEGG